MPNTERRFKIAYERKVMEDWERELRGLAPIKRDYNIPVYIPPKQRRFTGAAIHRHVYLVAIAAIFAAVFFCLLSLLLIFF